MLLCRTHQYTNGKLARGGTKRILSNTKDMGQTDSNKGHNQEIQHAQLKGRNASLDDFVLDKSIFNNIFEKDIRRVYIYKKAERLGKAIHLITPAFTGSPSLRNRIDAIAIGLIDAAILPPGAARTALSRELLALSSILSIARTGGFLSSMNSDLIAREAQVLLQEIASYEEPRLFLDDSPTLSVLAKGASVISNKQLTQELRPQTQKPAQNHKGHIKDTDSNIKDRREAVLSVIRSKGVAHIKDISTHIRGVSEKTIQRELAGLISAGIVKKEGERRWSSYSLAAL